MNDKDIRASFESLRKQSQVSLFLVVLGVIFLFGSVFYSVSKLRPLEEEITKRQAEISKLADLESTQRARLAELQQSFEKLKVNTESLYSVRVTSANEVYEVKATAIATGRILTQGRPEYKFTILINAPTETLNKVQSVTYKMEHGTFKVKDYTSTDSKSQFAKSYNGWGCLSSVEVEVRLKSGKFDKTDFDMCRSLGPQWQ